MPTWIIEELLKENSIDKVSEICQNSNKRPKVCIRVNKLNTTKEEVKKKLEGKGRNARYGLINDFLILNKTKNIENMEEFKKGDFTIQDEAAGLIPLILNPKEGEKILDACSSPGGKTTYMAEIMNNKGNIEAWDIHEHRVKLVQETSKRLGINIINAKVNDATIYKEEYKEYFDKILLDVPCLGMGVLKRKPDIKWQRKKQDIEEITKIQMKILETCSNYLKSGGELVYSTCSIFDEENRQIIEKFIEKNKEFEIVKIKEIEQEFFNKYIINSKYISVYQNEKTDGFFICKIAKK